MLTNLRLRERKPDSSRNTENMVVTKDEEGIETA
jgi:hypothetical protein